MKNTIILFFLLLLSAYPVLGQEGPVSGEKYQVRIMRSSGPILLDGVLDEESWKTADVASDFWLQFPKDNIKAEVKTEVRLTYDDDNLYIAAICYDVQEYVVQTLRRDDNFFEGDAFGMVIDPVNGSTNGFLFGLSPYNVQTEELLGPDAPQRNNMSFSWDNRWFSEVTRFPDRYIVEIAIPFKTLRFKSDINRWGINFFRNDLARNQYYSWTALPVNFELYDIGYTGDLVWDRPPAKTGTNISALPYTTVSMLTDNESNPDLSETNADVGVDAKVAVTSSLNLDLTVNPDFSQVDVDEQQTNLTRFNLRYPEKRGFFLENNDLFTEFASNDARPIFTRRIGLDDDRRPVPINYGARLSGNVNSKFRIGVMHLQTKAIDSGLGQNYSIAVFNHKVWSRSGLRGYATNRQAYTRADGWLKENYGRNTGLEFNYMNPTGTWRYTAAMHLSEKPEVDLGTFTNLALEYAGRRWKFRLNYWNISSDYYADIGFIPRLDNYDAVNDTIVHLGWERFYGRFGHIIRPKNRAVVAHDFEIRNFVDLYPDGTLSDRETRFDYNIKFRNTSSLLLKPQNFETNLIFATEFTEQEPLPVGNYKYSRFDLEYVSDERKALSLKTELGLGEYYNGSLTKYVVEGMFRRQPWGRFSFALEQNFLKLPEPYGESTITLVNAKAEVNFGINIFWSTFLQYNTQQENFNVNSRLQWRYSTMSDIFLVYTDNYSISPFMQNNRNRAILLKINYMFQL